MPGFAECVAKCGPNRFANALLNMNPAVGERVALLMPNCAEFIEADFAIAKAGKVKVPLNPRLSDDEREYILNDSGAETVIFDRSHLAFLNNARDRLPNLKYLIAVGTGNCEYNRYETLIEKGADSLPKIEVAPEAPSFILYTSGTTGRPKGATSSVRGRIAATVNMLADELDAGPGDGMIHAASVSHGSGSKILAYFSRGARNILLRKFDPELFFWTVEHELGTASFLVPTMINMLLESFKRGTFDVHSLRTISYGGSPIAPELLRKALDAFGPIFVQVYGSCEAPHPVLVLKKGDHVVSPNKEQRLSSAGREVTNIEVRLVASSGIEVADGEVGEILVRGDNVMIGYWGNDSGTADVFRGGFYRTGDVGRRDEDGFLYVVDREREMIISGGYNVYPAEVEAVLQRHPAILEAAVVGIPNTKWGEIVKAFVVLRGDYAMEENELIEYCGLYVAGYKKPRSVEFVAELPKGSTGARCRCQHDLPHQLLTPASLVWGSSIDLSSLSLPIGVSKRALKYRTPFARFGGALRDFSLPELARLAVLAALTRADLTPEDVDELALGVNMPGSDRSIARQALLLCGIPEDRLAYTVDRACCSSLSAIALAARSLMLGEARVAVGGGCENLSRVPYFLDGLRWGHRLGPVSLPDMLVISCPHTGVPRAVQASSEALEFGIGREEQDQWALRSQQRYAEALAKDTFCDEISLVRLEGPDGSNREFSQDEPPRPNTSLEKLSRLPTVYGSQTVTAGNAPDLSTGASAAVLMSTDEIGVRRIKPLAYLVTSAMVSGEPQRIASIPGVAARKVLAKAGMCLDDMSLLEINEAFAAVPLVSTLVLADGDRAKAEKLRARTNVNGGSIAMGHPTGATGGRLLMTLAYELRRRGGGYGLVTICGGVGEAEAVIIRVEDA